VAAGATDGAAMSEGECPETFVTDRLLAERLTTEHYDALLRMHQDAVQMAALGGVRDEQQTRTYMDRHLQHWLDFGFGMWILRDRESMDVAGRALLRHVWLAGQDEVEVGYSFHPAYWGRGLATEIATACVQLAFVTLHLPSVVALTLPTNLASQRVLSKAGLSFEREVIHDGLLHVLFRTR
jgi:ribosomal-protein-alanine N-acetyltransferase